MGSGEDDIQKVGYSHSKGRGSPIEVIRLSELRGRKLIKNISLPTRLDFYLIQFVTGGAGRHWADFAGHEISEGDVLQVQPNQVHAFDADSDHDALLLLFRPETVSAEQIRDLAVHFTLPIHIESQDFVFLIQLLELLLKINEVPENIRLISMAPGLLRAVISGLTDLYERQSGTTPSPSRVRASELIFRFERLLHRQSERHRLSELAEALHVTQKTLARACHQIRGQSPKKLLDHHFTLEAKRRLVLGEESVEEIGFDLGFTEATNFVKFFKRIAGTTPEAFRAEQRQP